MKQFLLLVTSLIFSTIIHARPLTVFINVPFWTPADDTIYLTADLKKQCKWQPNCIAMKKISAHTYQANIDIPEQLQILEYKITRGSWQTQATLSDAQPGGNFQIYTADQTHVVYSVRHWADMKPLGIEGELKIIKDFPAPQLSKTKTVRIWLPESYARQPNHEYPVIYMHDGQNLFDYQTTAFGHEWSIDENIALLKNQNKIREAIVVGVDSDGDRNDEYTYSKKGEAYARFLINNLKPYIDQNFRTLSNRENTYLMGSSMGALISFTILWKHSEVFSKAAGLSLPAFAHEDQVFKFLQQNPSAPENPVHFYMDHGEYRLDERYKEPAKKFVNTLINEHNFPADQLTYESYRWADHTEVDWARRVHIPLELLLR